MSENVIEGQLALDLSPKRRVILEPDTEQQQVFNIGRKDSLVIRDGDNNVVVLVEPE